MDKYNQQHTFHHPTKYNKLFLREREGKIESGGGGAEVGGRESQAGSTIRAEPNTGLDLTPLRSGPQRKSRVGCLID